MAGIIKTVATDGMGDGAFMFGEYDQNLSGEQITLAATTVEIPAGTVLGKITTSSLYVPINPTASDGSQNFAGILFGRRPISTSAQRAAAVVRRRGVNAMSPTQVAAAIAQAATAGVIIRF